MTLPRTYDYNVNQPDMVTSAYGRDYDYAAPDRVSRERPSWSRTVSNVPSATHPDPKFHYAYGPFGEVVRKTGAIANANPFRFSTKYQDDETGLLYYTFRYYDAIAGRWVSRDPLGEAGFSFLRGKRIKSQREEQKSLYGFTCNDPLNNADLLGLCKCGPDITGAFYVYLRGLVPGLKNLPSSSTGPIDGLFTMDAIGNNLDFWYKGTVEGCATEECKDSVYFSGTCVRSTVLNNVLYGFVAHALGIFFGDAVKAAGIHNIITHGSLEGQEQEGAYAIGFDLWGTMSGSGNPSNTQLDGIVGNSTVILPDYGFAFWYNSKDAIGRAFKNCKPCGKSVSVEQVTKKWDGIVKHSYD